MIIHIGLVILAGHKSKYGVSVMDPVSIENGAPLDGIIAVLRRYGGGSPRRPRLQLVKDAFL